MLKKILVPVDGSISAWKALDYASEIAKKFDGELVIVHIVQMPPTISLISVPFDTAMSAGDAFDEFAEKLTKDVDSKLTNQNVRYSVKMEIGHPSQKILEVAEREDCDSIVLGSRGLSGVKEFFLGSVSAKVSEYAKIPVMIVKSK